MRILELNYSRKKSDGNYGSVEMGARVEVNVGDSIPEILDSFIKETDMKINEVISGVKSEPVVGPDKPAAPKPETTPAKTKLTDVPKEVVKDEPKTEEPESPTTKEKPKTAAKKAPAKKTEAKKAPAKKVKEIVYDRENVTHKKELARILDDVCPEWRTPEIKPKAMQLSADLVGEVVYIDGEVATSFITLIIDGMA